MKLSNLVTTVLTAFLLMTNLVTSSAMEASEGKNNGSFKETSIEIVNGIIQECENAATCVLKSFADYVAEIREEQAFLDATRDKLASKLESYSCSDNSLPSSDPIRRESWRALDVSVMHERPASKIHLIEGFLSKDECKAMLDVAEKDILDPATVAGGPNFYNARKALQTNIAIPWKEEQEGNLIASASRRVYDYTNHVLEGLDIREHGQASLKYLHYSGRGRNDTTPDHYSPHCDGDCEGNQHQRGGRVATMVLYCETAEDGGHTNFQNAGVHINAKPGDALFFSYVDHKTLKTDNGLTVHSGCPVYEGNKKIITQWVRLGVSETQKYNSFRNF